MAKVFILTLYSAINVGAFLQAFALQQTVEELGFEVKFAKFPLNTETYHNAVKVKKYFKELPKLVFKLRSRIKYKFEQAKLHVAPIEEVKNFDYVIVGSDEVWNVCNTNFEHHPEYFGEGLNPKKLISYAPSANGVTEKEFRRQMPQIKFQNFTVLSARDKETKELVETISDKKVDLVVDPTLLVSDFKGAIEVSRKCRFNNFILVYSYGLNSEDIHKVISFANKQKMRTISVGTYNSWCDKNLVVSPFEFLDYLEKATYVITSTFHGTLLSIKYNKKFGIFAYQSWKVYGALEQYDLMDRELSRVDDIGMVLTKDIEYTRVNELIFSKRDFSYCYLKNALDCKM